MDQEKKYELTEEMRASPTGEVLHRIRALRTFGGVVAGTLGGWIQSEKNLSQEGNTWIYDDAMVFGNARLKQNAIARGDAWVCDNAVVFGDATISGGRVTGDSRIFGHATVGEGGLAGGYARIYGNAIVTHGGCVFDARVYGKATVTGGSIVEERAEVFDDAIISGNAIVRGNAFVGGTAWVHGEVCVNQGAQIMDVDDYVAVRGFGREYRTATFFRRQDGSVGVQCGCFCGSVQEFRVKVKETHGDGKMAQEYLMIADLMELHFKKE